MNVSYPKETKQIEGISEQTAKQNDWVWKKGRDSSKKPASKDIRNSLLFTEQRRVKKSRKMWWLEHAGIQITQNVVDNPADTGKLEALSVSWRKIGDNIKIYM